MTYEEAVNIQVESATPQMTSVGGRFVRASRDQIANRMYIDSPHSYQLMRIDQPTYLSEDEVAALLEGRGILEPLAEDFLEAQKKYGVNVIYLISHAILETGHGASTLAQGVTVDDTTYYNFFGIGAFDKTAIESGSSFASNANWTSPSKAVLGGAKFIKNNYIKNNQKSVYEMRWNPQNPGTHQYATDIDWAIIIARLMQEFHNDLNIEPSQFRSNLYKGNPES